MSILCFSGIKENLTFSDNLAQILKYFFFIYVTYHLTLYRGKRFYTLCLLGYFFNQVVQ